MWCISKRVTCNFWYIFGTKVCDERFPNKKTLKEHLRRARRYHRCDACGMQLSTRELFQTHMATHDPNSDTYDSNIVVTEGEKEMEEEEMEEGEGEEGADDGSDEEEQGQEGWKTKVYSDSPGAMGQQRQRSVSNRLVKV